MSESDLQVTRFEGMEITFPRHLKMMDNGCVAIAILDKHRKKITGYATDYRRIINYEGQKWKASRLAYHLNIEEIPKTPFSMKEGYVCHHCDHPWCVNLTHLYLGTASQNTSDIYARNKLFREKLRKSKIGNRNAKGNKFSEASRAKLSNSLRGNQNAKGNRFHLTPEQRNNRRWNDDKKQAWAEQMKGNTYRRDYLAKARQ